MRKSGERESSRSTAAHSKEARIKLSLCCFDTHFSKTGESGQAFLSLYVSHFTWPSVHKVRNASKLLVLDAFHSALSGV